MVVKKKLSQGPQTGQNSLSIDLTSKLERVRKAIQDLPPEPAQDEPTPTDIEESTMSTKQTAADTKKSNANQVTLAELCKRLKIEPRTARRVLRNAEFTGVEGARWVFDKKQAAKAESLLKEHKAN